jgi:hypothetical protein
LLPLPILVDFDALEISEPINRQCKCARQFGISTAQSPALKPITWNLEKRTLRYSEVAGGLLDLTHQFGIKSILVRSQGRGPEYRNRERQE